MNSSGFTFRRVREDMIENLLDMGIKDFRVLDAMSQVPRHLFIEEALWSRAYEIDLGRSNMGRQFLSLTLLQE